ncbi:hypothetical protein [Enterovirga sp. CN4-39]|uniref:hypothetical protein n=1 Tax=Enterovirga sp. CN4-39 TaxID=3400910 RepID=UPI003BFB9F4C
MSSSAAPYIAALALAAAATGTSADECFRRSAEQTLAQAEIRIPSEADLQRMERRSITTPPLDVGAAPRISNEAAENAQLDQRARRIDENLIGRGAICTDCQ